ncbi:MAG: insulinase family protein [Anaerolineales bacterium]|nr:insulinase family protein [Anaerolineales bacterium]
MSQNHVTKTRLRNGLTVILKTVHTVPIVSFWVWYRVGSRHEHTGRTGSSHWVEHMQFKGTEAFPADSVERAVSRVGGVWNAMTWVDWTAYFETMPADQIDLALQLEADRMTNSRFTEKDVESERTVIISERQGSENQPTFLLSEEVQAAAFRVHPYHHEVLGDQVDIETMTRDDLYEHYRAQYSPGNAIVVAVGDFKTTPMLKRIRTLFGTIPKSKIKPSLIRPEPKQRGERRIEINGEGQTAYLQAAYHAPAATDPDFFPMIVLDSILAGASAFNLFGGGISNKTSRLYRALVLTELAAGFSGSLAATVDPYLYSITCAARPESTLENLEAALDQEMDRAMTTTPTPQEMEKAKKQARAMFAYSAESVSNLGFWYGFAEILDQYTWFTNYLNRLNAVTATDVQRVAQNVLANSNRTVGHYNPRAH